MRPRKKFRRKYNDFKRKMDDALRFGKDFVKELKRRGALKSGPGHDIITFNIGDFSE